ncbi:carboxylating nicotinate-nucleotide diphosphorylase [Sodalinema gerasimenkoae]|uniref:carboxylating nicotinate-nucleotide diphosphorylase n=1 Tax=Sodalinema gerasimenkoae TaxID=2862348 RepID=UPI001356C094|nr:carboxylating nicotinate-nucleotide diphosphorylase [Sodalinema gerasimenkoae]
MSLSPVLPPWVVLDPLIQSWLAEDIGRGDRTSQTLLQGRSPQGSAEWILKAPGVIAGLPLAQRTFEQLDRHIQSELIYKEGTPCETGTVVARFQGNLEALLIGERVALNLVMRLSGIATSTRQYVETIADLPSQLTDTRKTTPGLRLLEKYATSVGGASNHRLGLDDAIMIKDNHIAAAGSIRAAVAQIRPHIPYPLTIEVETETLDQVKEALKTEVDIIMLDNMSLSDLKTAVELIRQENPRLKIEASGNITQERLRAIAETGVDYISTSAPISRSPWLDISMKLQAT